MKFAEGNIVGLVVLIVVLIFYGIKSLCSGDGSVAGVAVLGGIGSIAFVFMCGSLEVALLVLFIIFSY